MSAFIQYFFIKTEQEVASLNTLISTFEKAEKSKFQIFLNIFYKTRKIRVSAAD